MSVDAMNEASFWMSVVGLVLTVIGLWMSVKAIRKATSAAKMVGEVVGRYNLHEDLGRARDTLRILNRAKEAAMRRQAGSSRSMSLGRAEHDDLQVLQEAQDALAAQLPLEMDARDSTALEAHAGELNTALTAIRAGSNHRDAWKDALGVIQIAIPKLERVDRAARNKIVNPEPK